MGASEPERNCKCSFVADIADYSFSTDNPLNYIWPIAFEHRQFEPDFSL